MTGVRGATAVAVGYLALWAWFLATFDPLPRLLVVAAGQAIIIATVVRLLRDGPSGRL